jgi:MFS family permease
MSANAVLRRLPPWLHSRDLTLLLSARTLVSTGRALAGIVTPIYLTKIGYSGVELGVLFAVTAVVSGALTACVGLLADRYGCKPFLLIFPLLTALAAIAYLVTAATLPIFVFSALGTVGRGAGAGGGGVGPYVPAEQALVTATVSHENRSAAFGLFAFVSTIGALLGGLLAGLPDLAGFLGTHGLAIYRPAYYVLFVLCVAAALLAVPLTPWRPTQRPQKRRRLLLPRRSMPLLLRLAVTNSMNGFAIGAFAPFITLWFHDRYGASTGEIGVLFAVINLLSATPSLFAGRVATRIGLVRTVTLTRLGSALLVIVMVAMPTFLLAGAIYLVRMVLQRLNMPLRQSFMMGVAPEEERASVAGLANLPSQMASATTPALAGYLYDHIAIALPFELGGVLQALNAGLYWFFFRHMLPPEELERRAAAIALHAATTAEPDATADEPASEAGDPESSAHGVNVR